MTNPTRRARYQGKTWTLEYLGPTRFGRKAKLSLPDGTVKWAKAHLVEELPDPDPAPAFADEEADELRAQVAELERDLERAQEELGKLHGVLRGVTWLAPDAAGELQPTTDLARAAFVHVEGRGVLRLQAPKAPRAQVA